MFARLVLPIACAIGATSIALGAFGAHWLAGRLDARGERLFALASHYALVHAVALLALGLASSSPQLASRMGALSLPAGLWTAGTVLFAGSLVALALGAPRAMGAVTPMGGLCLIAGWLALAWRAAL